MKGVIFTEFMELVEARLGLEIVDRIIDEAAVPNDGAYTAVGTYDHQELFRLLGSLSRITNTPVPCLIRMFGEHLFGRFASGYRELLGCHTNLFDFLDSIDGVIHGEVRKLYPDAELPRIVCTRLSGDEFLLDYSSPRGLGDLAEGLIHGAIAHFRESVACSRRDLPQEGRAHHSQFHLTKSTP